MADAPLVLALIAGMVAAFNPCGFAMLPAYLGFVIEGTGESPSRAAAVSRALLMTAAMTLGFVVVFGVFGLVISPLAVTIEQYLPYVTVVIGVALVGLGGWLLSGREIFLSTPKMAGSGVDRGLRSMGLYGVAYAVASLSCTVGPFLALVSGTLRSGSVLAGVSAFVAYAVGMGLVVGVLAVAVALARQSVVTGMRRVLPYIGRISGALVLVAGVYVAYYGYFEIRVLQGGATGDPLVDAVTRVQASLTRAIDSVGPWLALGAAAVLLALVLVLRRRRRTDAPDEKPSSVN